MERMEPDDGQKWLERLDDPLPGQSQSYAARVDPQSELDQLKNL